MPASHARKQTTEQGGDGSKTVAVLNDARHIKCFWYVKQEDGTFTAKGASSANEFFQLLPGLNDDVPRPVWNAMMDVAIWAQWRENGDVSLMDKPPTGMSPRQALDLIESSASISAMQRWRRVEKRKPVQIALDKKILEMKRIATPERHTGQPPSEYDE